MSIIARATRWKRKRLGDIAKTASGGTPKRTVSAFYGGGIPWVKSGELGDGTVYETEESISKVGLDASSAKIFPKGTLCIALYGATVGKLGILGLDAATNQAVCGIFLPECLDTRFAYRFLESRRRELVELGKGGAQSNISQEIIRDLEFPIPPIEEQQEIVAEIEKQFTRLEAGVAGLRRVQANLKRYRAAVLKAACEGKLVPTEAELARQEGRNFESGAQLLERILIERRQKWNGKGKYNEPDKPDTAKLPQLPNGWIWSTLGQVFDVYVGATPSRQRNDYWNGEIPWVSSGEVSFCRIRQTRERITELGLANSSTEIHPPGTILIGMIGEGRTRGQVAILDVAACNNQNSAAIRVSEARLPPEYTYYFLMSQYEQNRKLGSGNNQPALNKTRVQNISFPLPPVAEQQRLVAEVDRRLSVVEELEAVVNANLQRVRRLRQSILQRAFDPEFVR